MKISELHRKYADALDLCENHGIKYIEAIRAYGSPIGGRPMFIEDPECYTFPVAVVESKPVFVGDELYDSFGHLQIIQVVLNADLIAKNYTWNPPKPKTFMLNGVELVAPDNMGSGHYTPELSHYAWKNPADRDAFRDTIRNLLNGK